MRDTNITVQWVSLFDEAIANAIVSLVDCATRDGGTLGYVRPMARDEADSFLANLQRRTLVGESHVLLGHLGSVPACLAVLTQNGMHNCRHRAEISKGVVHPMFRGRHLVEVMFRECVDRAESLDIEQFVLDVREGSRAHALWQQFGFTTYGILDDYARVDEIRHRGSYMVQSVASLRARLSTIDRKSNREKESTHA